MMAKEANLPF